MKSWGESIMWAVVLLVLVATALVLVSVEYLWDQTIGREHIEGEEEY